MEEEKGISKGERKVKEAKDSYKKWVLPEENLGQG